MQLTSLYVCAPYTVRIIIINNTHISIMPYSRNYSTTTSPQWPTKPLINVFIHTLKLYCMAGLPHFNHFITWLQQRSIFSQEVVQDVTWLPHPVS